MDSHIHPDDSADRYNIKVQMHPVDGADDVKVCYATMSISSLYMITGYPVAVTGCPVIVTAG